MKIEPDAIKRKAAIGQKRPYDCLTAKQTRTWSSNRVDSRSLSANVRAHQMPIFCARLLVVCLVDDGKPKKRNTCDYPFVLLEATDHESAFYKGN
jgi:hypothetical protein